MPSCRSPVNLCDIKGDTWSRVITVTISNLPLDITGFTFFATLKSDYDDDATDSTAVYQKTWTTHSDPTDGQTTWTADPTDTNIPAGIYKYDIQYKDLSGNIETVAFGQFEVLPEVTNRIS